MASVLYPPPLIYPMKKVAKDELPPSISHTFFRKEESIGFIFNFTMTIFLLLLGTTFLGERIRQKIMFTVDQKFHLLK